VAARYWGEGKRWGPGKAWAKKQREEQTEGEGIGGGKKLCAQCGLLQGSGQKRIGALYEKGFWRVHQGPSIGNGALDRLGSGLEKIRNPSKANKAK